MLASLFHIPASDADLRRRGQMVISVAGLLLILILLGVLMALIRPNPGTTVAGLSIGLIALGGAIGMARLGRIDGAGWLLTILSAAAVLLPSLMRGEIATGLFFLAVPQLVAGLVLRPRSIWIVLGLLLAGVAGLAIITPEAARVSSTSQFILWSVSALLSAMAVLSYLSARMTHRAFVASREAEVRAQSLAHEFEWLNASLETQIEARTIDLQLALEEVNARAAEKQSLLDELDQQRALIREMSVPVLPVNRSTLVMPLIGALDSQRLLLVQDQALAALERSRSRTLLLDITGVPVVDTQVAQGLIRTVQAARLLGAETMLVGVRPEVAQALVALGVDLSSVRTASDLQSALSRR